MANRLLPMALHIGGFHLTHRHASEKIAAILLSRTAQKSKIQTALFSKQRMLSC